MDRKKQPEERSSVEEHLEWSYHEARDPVERSHRQIAWLLARGKAVREVAEATGYSERWVREIARRHREHGAAGLGDRRHKNPGGAGGALLGREQREELGEALKAPPPDGGLWSSRKVAEWIEEHTGRRGVRAQRGWEYLRKLGHTPQVPRPSSADADLEEREAFKKAPRAAERPSARPPGRRGRAVGRGRDARRPQAGAAQGLGAARAETGGEGAPPLRVGLRLRLRQAEDGGGFWLVNAQAFSLALSRFAEWVGAGEDKRVVLVLDRAGWHVARDLKVPEGLHLEFLPARSPELQPAERLWPLVNERVANRPFEDLDELEGTLVEWCLALSDRSDLLRGHTSYRWWPEAA